MTLEPKREKFLFWLIKHSKSKWLWFVIIIAASVLVNSGGGLLAGLGLVLVGSLSFASGINTTLEVTLGDDYAEKGLWKNKEKEKKK